ncbi:MAG: hypothetical protein ACXWAS_13955 [Methylobacter sp.]
MNIEKSQYSKTGNNDIAAENRQGWNRVWAGKCMVKIDFEASRSKMCG